ncbi:MAG: hypothetical protein ACRD0V_02180 [Acidimicrobiales bacterium]
MAASNARLRTLAARAGGSASYGHDVSDDLRRELLEARISAHVEKLVADAPPLTAEQVERISALLRPAATSTDTG